ncbi:MAG: pyridoxal phosphate-dependent aminotransferase [Lachnospiraceae bacterium]|jgi:aspartate aminotransferase|nr:pyridoxal phosphate-dependent aminotransferase [Lachnospiraceae bacterium]
MISKKMTKMVANSSAIRAMFEEGNRLAKEYGRENVFDFSLGNPSTPAPIEVNDGIIDAVSNLDSMTLHGYNNSNAGFEDVRDAIAKSLNKRFDTYFEARNILMTVGAAGGLNVALKSILDPEDEVIVFAPYFGEYKNYVENYDGVLVTVPPCPGNGFVPSLEEFEKLITPKTKAIIINNPNNPTGVILNAEFIKNLCAILRGFEARFEHEIYLISDEPYRELAYEEVEVPYLTKYYANTIVGYSFSKSLSIPGERIGYLVIPDEVKDYDELFNACVVATRILGFVNAPTLLQQVVKRSLEAKTDLEFYDRNRLTLYEGLESLGFDVIKPQGAFYLFMKAPIADEKEFVANAKKYNILIVPGSSFGAPGYVRIAYCVAFETIKNSMEAWKKLAADYNL